MVGEFQLGDQTVALTDLAGISMDDMSEVRGYGLPRGVYLFKVKSGEFKVIDTSGGNKPAAQFECEVLRVLSLAPVTEGEPIDPNTLIGKTHNETFFLNTEDQNKLAESIGRVKAFLADIGAVCTGVSLEDAIKNSAGVEFTGPIARVTNKKDPDREYINIKHDKVKPASGAAA